MTRPTLLGYGLLAVTCLAGCGGPRGVEASGAVTFDGKPIAAGRIYFFPDLAKGNDGRQGFAEIRDGKFDTRLGSGQAISGGPSIVAVRGFDGDKDKGQFGSPLFEEYRFTLELPRESFTRDFDVPANAPKSRFTPGKGKLP